MAVADAAPDMPLELLTARIGSELEVLAGLSARVQQALSLCHFAPHTDPEAIRGLQGIDRITQSLEDLGRLMADLSGEIPPGLDMAYAPIFARLRLHELMVALDPAHGRHEIARDNGDVQWL